MRSSVEWRSGSKQNYIDFCKKNPSISISYSDWKMVIYLYNELFRDKILETGDKLKFPAGIGEFSIQKKKRKKIKVIDGKEFVNLPIDWKKTKEKGKKIYNFNYHTEGYFFGWMWFKDSARFQYSSLFYFKPTRVTSRKLSEYLLKDQRYQNLYHQWVI